MNFRNCAKDRVWLYYKEEKNCGGEINFLDGQAENDLKCTSIGALKGTRTSSPCCIFLENVQLRRRPNTMGLELSQRQSTAVVEFCWRHGKSYNATKLWWVWWNIWSTWHGSIGLHSRNIIKNCTVTQLNYTAIKAEEFTNSRWTVTKEVWIARGAKAVWTIEELKVMVPIYLYVCLRNGDW